MTEIFKRRLWLPVLLILTGFFFDFVLTGYHFSAQICYGLAALWLVRRLIALLSLKHPKGGRIMQLILTVLIAAGLTVVTVTGIMIYKASLGTPDPACEYVLVLGSKVRGTEPSLSLKNRIDAAYTYLTENPEDIAILSGGQGPDEGISEAQCMYEHLTERGIDGSRLWLEDRSTSTWENLHFSLDLIQEKTGARPEKLAVISSEYHLYRAGMFARACGVGFAGIPAKTTIVTLRINYFLREIAGVWHYILLGGRYQ